jgi:hypothetical protein
LASTTGTQMRKDGFRFSVFGFLRSGMADYVVVGQASVPAQGSFNGGPGGPPHLL